MTMERDPKDICRVMGMMADLELKVSEFYRECGDLWPQDKEFWSSLEKEEISHSGSLQKMAELFSARPERFAMNRPYNIASLSLALTGVQSLLLRLKKGQIHKENILFAARDLEQSLLENKPWEVLKTGDGEYTAILRDIAAQTLAHRRRLENRIAELKRPPAG
jgi:hypothetical protein